MAIERDHGITVAFRNVQIVIGSSCNVDTNQIAAVFEVFDRIGSEVFLEMKHVGTVASSQDVVVQPAVKSIVTVVTREGVVSFTANNCVIVSCTCQNLIRVASIKTYRLR